MSAAETTGRPDAEPPVVLTEPARQRLVTIAADVIGRLPVDEVPAALRPIARFTPIKRVRLGATLLSAALDSDEVFRGRVADVVAEASAPLVEAVRNAGPTSASDPVDTAVVAYLLRPDGWQRLVAEANERWAAERHSSGEAASQAELDRLRADVAELRAQQRADAVKAKETAAAAVDAAAAEFTEVRRQLRVRTGELRAAERALEEAQGAVAEALRQAETAEAAREAEVRRMRSRIGELERAVESARRTGRTERDVDDARLWLLVDTITEAAAGVRRELSLPVPAVRPADGVSSAASATARRSADDAASLDRLLALPNVHLIVDGYNVTKTGYGELPLADQRTRLLASMAALTGRAGVEITVAFDGGRRPPSLPTTPRGVRVLFSEPDEIADDLIRRLVAAEPAGRPVIVVSSDHEVQRDIERSGAWSVPSAVLLARVAQV